MRCVCVCVELGEEGIVDGRRPPSSPALSFGCSRAVRGLCVCGGGGGGDCTRSEATTMVRRCPEEAVMKCLWFLWT